jgi:hypothetical protein
MLKYLGELADNLLSMTISVVSMVAMLVASIMVVLIGVYFFIQQTGFVCKFF